jgi:hypothetical protein
MGGGVFLSVFIFLAYGAFAYDLRLRKPPFAAQDLLTGPIEPHRVIPVFHDRQTIWNLAVATAELHIDGFVCVFPRGDVIQRIGIAGIFS